MKKVYAYSDDDGYIHYNVQEGSPKSSIWSNQTRTWLKREPLYDIDEGPGVWFWSMLATLNVIIIWCLLNK